MDLTADQKATLEKFRKNVEHLVPESFKSDYELSKWLIARNFNLKKAEDMLLKSLEWRKRMQVDDVINWKRPEVLKKYMCYGMPGFDKEGCPVWIVPYMGTYLRSLLQCCSYKDFIKAVIWVLETSRLEMQKQTKLLGKPIFRHTIIFDFDGFSLLHFATKPSKDVFPDMLEMYEANYPEHLKAAYILNAPKVFSVGFAIVKPFLADSTIKKVEIFGKSGWKEALLKVIPSESLPEYYGGCMKDADGNPKWTEKVSYGGEIPKSFYLKKEKKSRKGEEGYKTLNLSRGSKEVIELDIKEPNSDIKWEFLSEDFDIGFGVCRITPSGEEEYMIPLQRVNAQLFPDEGSVRCMEVAKHKVIFDNEYSYFRGKKLKYILKVVPPAELDERTQL